MKCTIFQMNVLSEFATKIYNLQTASNIEYKNQERCCSPFQRAQEILNTITTEKDALTKQSRQNLKFKFSSKITSLNCNFNKTTRPG